MDLTDPNLYLGQSVTFAAMLIILTTVAIGVLTLTVSSRLLRLPSWLPNTVLLVHLAIGATTYVVLGPFSMSPDGQTYDAQAVDVASRFGFETPFWFDFPLHTGKEGFPLFLGLIYSLVGREPLAGIALNCLVTAFTSLVVMASAKKVFGAANPWPVLIYLGSMPAFITLGPAVMREAMCWLGISLVCYLVATVVRGQSLVIGIVAGLSGLGLLYFVRTGLAFLVFVALCAGLVAGLIWTRYGGKAIAWLIAMGLALVLIFGDTLLTFAGYNANYVISNREFNATTATTGYSVWLGPLEYFGIPGYMVAALPKILLGPLPWELAPKLVWGWVLLSALYWWAALAAGARNVIRRGLDLQTIVYLVMSVVLLVALAAFFSNYGVLTRMRSLPLVVLIVVLSGVVKFPMSERTRTSI